MWPTGIELSGLPRALRALAMTVRGLPQVFRALAMTVRGLPQVFRALAMIGGLLPIFSGAIPADDLQPIDISANGFYYDNIKGIATYTGNVIATQGSRKMTGDKLELVRNAHGNIAEIILHGHPAQHQSLTDANKPLFFAKANTIHYDPLAKYLTLSENAWIAQAGDEYTAPLIEYDVGLQTMKSAANTQGRTTITIKPRP